MADETQRQRIELVCPECGHHQQEPAIVVSSQCRACQAYFEITDGRVVSRPKTIEPFAKVRTRNPSDEAFEPIPAAQGGPPRKPSMSERPKRPLWMRLLQPLKPPRLTSCFECSHPFEALGNAQSSQCPKCGSYVSLLDYEIGENWNRNIQTRGDVKILKSGTIAGASVRCHDLIVLGDLNGTVECSGDLVIRSHGKIIGAVQCRHLRVEKGARVEFLNPVKAGSASIDGQVRGQIHCTGVVTLQKRAQLDGLVRTTSLVVKPGARHNGVIEVVNPSES